MNQFENVEVQNNNAIIDQSVNEATSLSDLIRSLVVSSINRTDENARDLLTQIKDRQARMRFLNTLMRALNNTKNDDGTLEIKKSAELMKLREEVRNMEPEINKLKQEAQNLKNEADQLTKQAQSAATPDEKQRLMADASKKKALAEVKLDTAADLEQIVATVDLLLKKDKLKKEERMTLIDNVKSTFDDINAVNQLEIQRLNRMMNEMHERIMIGKSIAEKDNQTKSLIARHIAGR